MKAKTVAYKKVGNCMPEKQWTGKQN